jgi:glycine betaine/choline ABC-type transport system substrate-binding protein
MAGTEVVVGGTTSPTDRIMSAMLVVALEQRGATVIDRSDTGGDALNRDDLMAGRLDVVPEDLSTGWFVHLGQETEFPRTTELAAELRAGDRTNGIEWSDHSSFDDAIAAVARREIALLSDGGVVSMQQLARRLEDDFDAIVCVDDETLQSPDGLVRFERFTDFTVPAEQLRVVESEELVSTVADGDCSVAFAPAVDPAIPSAGLVVVDRPADGIPPQLVFRPRNAAYMFDADFFESEAEWLTPFLEALMVTLDAETMMNLKAELAAGVPVLDVARAHLERSELL